MTRTEASQAQGYLHVMTQYENGHQVQRWNVYQLSDASPRITLAGSVTSYDDARRLAAKSGRPLQIAAGAWHQMVAAGRAPRKPPKDATIT
jgi:tRNA-dihydrouridine synthase